ncbi:hypothetical protein ACSXC4_05685 [Clostridium perfringens]|nr:MULTISPECIES: hypothetical protein [Clostridium]MDK7588372.1 hypothetical protein [Clostridium sp. UMB9555B]MDK7627289.1 hypothetical protein [Clostridium sp. UMB9555A]
MVILSMGHTGGDINHAYGITGITIGYLNKELSSNVGLKGMAKNEL